MEEIESERETLICLRWIENGSPERRERKRETKMMGEAEREGKTF